MGAWQQTDAAEPFASDKSSGRPSNSSLLIDLAVLSLRVLEMGLIFLVGFVLVQVRGDELAGMAADHYRLAALGMAIYSGIATAVGAYDAEALFTPTR